MDDEVSKGLLYAAFNKHVFDLIPSGIASLLDVGCGTGALGKAIKDRSPSLKISGITFSSGEAELAKKVYGRVFVHDINNLSLDVGDGWDCIIFSHILEHTYQPHAILHHYGSLLNEGGIIIIALPNILFYKQRLEFLKGNFQYSDKGGLMDSTHFRFFDFKSALQLVLKGGLEIVNAKGQGAFPLGPIRRLLPSIAKQIDDIMVSRFPGMFAFQFLIIAKKKSG